ncbi:MAG: glycosyltransferase [Myxococcota bacterium]|nr:glycosyltransferase [Myxococcota bacterium]
MARPTILVLTKHYLPGFKYGGPIRTLANAVAHLGQSFDFRIVTTDRDAGDSEAFTGIDVENWEPVGKGHVYYLPPLERTPMGIRDVIRKTSHTLLYINSFFDPRFSIAPLILRRLGLIPKKPVLLAPRGELAPGALAVKSPKKQIYIQVAKRLGLYRDIFWQASSPFEEEQIRHVFGAGARVFVASNLAPPPGSTDPVIRRSKEPRELRAFFLGRVAVNKNLLGALEVIETLQDLDGDFTLNVFGPQEDLAYWERCEDLIGRLPANCRVNYSGIARPEEISQVVRDHDLLFLPTHGENFGQAIFESLSHGCPVLISDQTPWRELESKGIGWDVPLDQPERFRQVIERCMAMDETEHREWCERAGNFAREFSHDETHVETSRRMFYETLED